MTSKDRVIRSIRHESVDRTPYFFLAVPRVQAALAEHFGRPPADGESVLQALDVDVRYVWPRLVQVPGEDRQMYPCGAVHARMHNAPGGQGPIASPVGAASTVKDLDGWRWPDPDWFDYSIPAASVEVWRDKAVVAYDMGILFLYAMGVRGMEAIMLDMAGDPPMAHAILTRIADFNYVRSRRFLDANRGVIHVLGIGDDVAGQAGMIISPNMWREFLKPHVQRLVDLCREFSVVPYYHGCGGFRALYPDFVEMGIACTGRLQTEAKGNDLREVKKEFGADLCLWGAIDAQHAVIEGTTDQVRAHVRQVLDTGSRQSGFVAGPTHSFTEDTPTENVLAVYEVLAGRPC